VGRGELDIDPSVLEGRGRELREANGGKAGGPYHYPESFIGLLAFVRLLFHMPYRQTRGSCASSPGSRMGRGPRTTPR